MECESYVNPPTPPTAETTPEEIEQAFRTLTARRDIVVILINQSCANEIRWLLEEYREPVPSVLEIPSKSSPYDPEQDSVLRRVKQLLGASR
jgi:V-type H+-transporting ATPase subunit F